MGKQLPESGPDDRAAADLLVESIQAHPKVAPLLEKIKSDPKFKIDISLMDEIRGYVSIAKHSNETADKIRIPSRYKTGEDVEKLGVFIARTQAYRDRVIEIKLGILPLQRAIHRIHKKAHDQLMFFDSIRNTSPAPARDAFIDSILYPITRVLCDIDTMMDALNEADRHLGNAFFSIKELRTIGAIFIESQKAVKGV